MYEDVADLGRGYEARVAGQEVGGGEGAGLDAEGAEDEEGFFCLGRRRREWLAEVGGWGSGGCWVGRREEKRRG